MRKLKIIKKSLILVIVSMILSLFCGCDYITSLFESDDSSDEDGNNKPQYECIPFENDKVFYRPQVRVDFRGLTILIKSKEQIAELNMDTLIDYDESFFEENYLMLMRYEHSSAIEIFGVDRIEKRENNWTYIILSASIPDGGGLNDDLNRSLIVCEVKREDIKTFKFEVVLEDCIVDYYP